MVTLATKVTGGGGELQHFVYRSVAQRDFSVLITESVTYGHRSGQEIPHCD